MPTARTPVAAPSMLDTLGAYARSLFPNTVAVSRETDADYNRYVAAGDYARAAGASLRGAVAAPAGVITDAVGRPALALARGVGNVIGGALGSDGSTVVTPTPAAKVAAAAVAPAAAVNSALAQGRTATPSMTPQDEIGAYIHSVLGSGKATVSDAAALAPLVGQAIKVPQTAKDSTFGQTAQLSQAIYANQVAQAQELAKTDPDGAKAVVQKATDAYFQRNSGLLGFDPSKLALAAQLGTPGE